MKLTDTMALLLEGKGRQVWSLPPSATVFDAIQMMSDKRVGALLVISDSILLGVISERDYARKVILKGRSSKETRISEIMTRDLVTVTAEHSVDECMRIMTRHRIRHLPVLEGETVIGVVSIGDLVKWIISAHEETIHVLHTYIAGEYPG